MREKWSKQKFSFQIGSNIEKFNESSIVSVQSTERKNFKFLLIRIRKNEYEKKIVYP